MSSIANHTVAIIGAGPAGLCAALALHQQAIPCEIYESRKEPSKVIRNYNGTLFMISNGSSVLHSLGAYDNLRSRSLLCKASALRNSDNSIRSVSDFNPEDHGGFKWMRTARRDLHEGLLDEVLKRGITVHVDKAFKHVLAESDNSVTFELEDGEVREARLLIGADGINSKVRTWIAPDIEPQYTGTILLGSLIKQSALRFPTTNDDRDRDGFHFPTFVYGDPGVVALVPQAPDEDGTDMLLFTQHYTAKERSAWEPFRGPKSKQIIVDTMRSHIDYWQDPVRSGLEAINSEKLIAWPVHTLPHLERWTSESYNVILIGDAAHAVDPASAQGVNQSFEDGLALALLLKVGIESPEMREVAMERWVEVRRERLGLVGELARINQNMRKPVNERVVGLDQDAARKVVEELALYDCEKDVGAWIREHIG